MTGATAEGEGGALPGIVDPRHRRPEGIDDETVAAVGKVSEALERLERARGRLYDFHQMIGHLDLQMGDAAAMLREAGHGELAQLPDSEVVGRNVLDGRWTFLEEFDDLYDELIRSVERLIRDRLVAGRPHVDAAEMKERRRTAHLAGHEARPPAAHHPNIVTGGPGVRYRLPSGVMHGQRRSMSAGHRATCGRVSSPRRGQPGLR